MNGRLRYRLLLLSIRPRSPCVPKTRNKQKTLISVDWYDSSCFIIRYNDSWDFYVIDPISFKLLQHLHNGFQVRLIQVYFFLSSPSISSFLFPTHRTRDTGGPEAPLSGKTLLCAMSGLRLDSRLENCLAAAEKRKHIRPKHSRSIQKHLLLAVFSLHACNQKCTYVHARRSTSPTPLPNCLSSAMIDKSHKALLVDDPISRYSCVTLSWPLRRDLNLPC